MGLGHTVRGSGSQQCNETHAGEGYATREISDCEGRMSWPRTEAGTLQCPCGKPGKIFILLSTYEKDGKKYGDFAVYCSEECKDSNTKRDT